CPLACEDSPLVALDGRRAHVHAYLTKAGSFFPTWHERGEVLFRSYGLSGIVTFDLSRRAETGDLVELDLAPDLNKSQLMQRIAPFTSTSFESGCLDGVLDPQIASLLERLAHERWHLPWPERTSPKTDAEALVLLVKALPFKVTGPTETNHAQVTRGGLVTSQFDAQTLSAHEVPWCFACGEALDIDADCGGFNLSWAWKSGMVAGASAARHALEARG
ncbi:MAG: NAD(P)/FAD-dependent oxidoreductase, partial [Coriobacteriales bacterium]|nr:NAD(P)/FAD-dependent oxidoreductase [Coriobacteriales bacterium]